MCTQIGSADVPLEVMEMMRDRGFGAKMSSSKDRWIGFKLKFLAYFSNQLREKLRVSPGGGGHKSG